MAKSGAKHTGLSLDYGTVLSIGRDWDVFTLEQSQGRTAQLNVNRIWACTTKEIEYGENGEFVIERIYEAGEVIKGTGRIDYLSGDFGYVRSDNNGERVFFFARNFRGESIHSKVLLKDVLTVNTRVVFEAIKRDDYSTADYRAVYVAREKTPKVKSVPSIGSTRSKVSSSALQNESDNETKSAVDVSKISVNANNSYATVSKTKQSFNANNSSVNANYRVGYLPRARSPSVSSTSSIASSATLWNESDNETKSSVNVRKPSVNSNKSSVNVRQSSSNANSSAVNVSKPSSNANSQAVNVRKTPFNANSSAVNVSKPSSNANSRAVNVSKPSSNANRRAVNVSKPSSNTIGAEEGIIINHAPYAPFLHLWSRNLGRVFCPQSELDNKMDKLEFKLGKWVSFSAEIQPEHDGCGWIARKVSLSTRRVQFELHQASNGFKEIEVKNCVGMVTCLLESKGEAVVWHEYLGRIWVNKKEIEGWKNEFMRPLTYIEFDAEPYKQDQMEYSDIGWRAIKIRPIRLNQQLPTKTYKECKATVSEVHPKSGCAMLNSINFGFIFITFLDYFEDTGSPSAFKDHLKKHEHFKVLIVPNKGHAGAEWRAIFVRPWSERDYGSSNRNKLNSVSGYTSEEEEMSEVGNEVEEVCDLPETPLSAPPSNPPPVRSSSGSSNSKKPPTPTKAKKGSKAASHTGCMDKKDEKIKRRTPPSPKGKIKYESVETQTDKQLEHKLFSLLLNDKNLLEMIKEKYRSFIRPMAELMSGRFVPDIDKAEGLTLEKNAQTQTARTPEKDIAGKIVGDQEIFDAIIDINSDLLFDVNDLLM